MVKSVKSAKLIKHLYALQNAECCPWSRPLIRLFTNFEPLSPLCYRLTFYVYFSRLIFELIADSDIQAVMESLRPISKVRPTTQIPPQVQTLTSTAGAPKDGASSTGTPIEDFTLPALLRAAESTGYTPRDPQPEGLKVQLFEYQRSTYQWMLDHERDPRGLNALFWERWEWGDADECAEADKAFYYFPLAGELRVTEPPYRTGGLLCEEMGLGSYAVKD